MEDRERERRAFQRTGEGAPEAGTKRPPTGSVSLST